jgi:cell division protein FtsW
VVLALCAGGLLVLGSAGTVRGYALHGDAAFFLKRQLVWLGAGTLMAVLVSRWDYRRWKALACPLGILSLGLLIIVLIFGPRINGCRRWLLFGPISFQPSELAKLATVILLAYWFSRVPLRIGRLREGLLIPGFGLGAVMGLVLLEPDFGTTALIGAVGWTVLLLAGADKRWLIGAAVVGALLLFLYVRFNPRRWELILAWLDPEGHPKLAYHYLQAEKAYILGGVTGVGYLNSIEKHSYLPEVHTDFILPVVGEELGLVGTLSVLALFAGFLACGTLISLLTPDLFGRLLGLGITILVTLQAVFNACVVTGLLPTKGLALPFFSYGGSNLLMTLIACGILIGLGRQAARRESQGSPG